MDSRLPANQQWTRKFPVVGERTPAPDLSRETFRLRLCGEVERPLDLDFDQLLALPQVDLTCDIHCVTRWSRADTQWRGVDLRTLMEMAAPKPEARFVRFVAHSTRQHDTTLPLELCLNGGVLVAHQLEGQPLDVLHGGPVRTVTPSLYFYKSLKWLAAISLLEEDRLGTWERNSGYHNEADPWREQRYVARGVSRQKLAELLATGRFPGVTLLQADLSGRSLRGFDFSGAGIKDSDFRGADLEGANFRGANLTNSDLRRANLQGADFEGADLEGARFAEADLRKAKLSGASLAAAELYDPELGPVSLARMDGDELRGANLDGLVEDQLEVLLNGGWIAWFDSSS